MQHGHYATVLYGAVIAAVETGVGLGRATTRRRLSVVLPLAGLAFAFLAGAIWAKTITGTAGNDTLRGRLPRMCCPGKAATTSCTGSPATIASSAVLAMIVSSAVRELTRSCADRDATRRTADARDRVAGDCEIVTGIPEARRSPVHRPPAPLPGQKIDVGGYSLYIECCR